MRRKIAIVVCCAAFVAICVIPNARGEMARASAFLLMLISFGAAVWPPRETNPKVKEPLSPAPETANAPSQEGKQTTSQRYTVVRYKDKHGAAVVDTSDNCSLEFYASTIQDEDANAIHWAWAIARWLNNQEPRRYMVRRAENGKDKMEVFDTWENTVIDSSNSAQWAIEVANECNARLIKWEPANAYGY